MECPGCKTGNPETVEIEPGLAGKKCPECGGMWLPAIDYIAWRQRQSEDLPEVTDLPAEPVITETTRAKICPDCGHLLVPYRLGHGLAFTIDRCGGCNGIWLDRDEWESLRRRNLHDNLLQVFSEDWQRKVREESHREAMKQLYRERFGVDDFAEIQRIKRWLEGHPQRSALLAYLAYGED